MAVQLDQTTRNAVLDAVESTNGTSCCLEIRSGAQPADCATVGSGTVLATINLPSDWMSNAASGSKAKLGVWQDAAADNTGTAGHFRVYRSQATKDNTTCFMQGSAGTSGTDMILDSTNFSAGQPFTVNSFTLGAGNP
jgi:hypothetical protein